MLLNVSVRVIGGAPPYSAWGGSVLPGVRLSVTIYDISGLANKCEDTVNLQGAEAYCVATRTAC